MTWYILAGEELKRDEKIKFPFYRSVGEKLADDELTFVDQLIQCESTHPATYPGQSTSVNCTLTADLRGINRDLLQKKTSANFKRYYDIEFDLVVTLEAASPVMKFSLEVGGQEMGSVKARYD